MCLAFGSQNHTPYTNFREIAFQKYECIEGPCCEVINILSFGLKRKFHFIFPTDGGHNGVPMENGSWNGLVGLVQSKEVEIASWISFSFDRLKVVDLAFPLGNEKIVFAIQSARPISTNYALFHPFQLSTWICILLSFLVCLVVLTILRRRKRSVKSVEAFAKDLVSSAEILMGKRNIDRDRRNPAVRLFFTFSIWFMIFLAFCYSAVLLAFIMAPIKEPQINTFAELAQAAKIGKVKIGILGQSKFINSLLSTATSGILKDLADNVKHRHTKNANYTGLMQMLDDGYAFIEYSSILNSMFGYDNKEIHISDNAIIENVASGIILQKNSKYQEKVNWILQRLRETGTYQKIFNDFKFKSYLKIHQQYSDNNKQVKSKQVSLTDLKGLFIIMALGFLIALKALMFEGFLAQKKRLRN